MKYSRGLNRIYCLVSGLWFLAWLAGFPLYTRSNDLRDAEFFAQYIYVPTTFESDTQPEPTPPKPTAEKIERVKQLVQRQESFLKDNPRLAEDLAREEKRLTREIFEQVDRASQIFSSAGKPADVVNDRVFRAELHHIWGRRTELARKQMLGVAQEQAGFFNTYKQLWKSNWRNWGSYILLGPVIVYVGIFALTLAVRWVVQGFQNSGGESTT